MSNLHFKNQQKFRTITITNSDQNNALYDSLSYINLSQIELRSKRYIASHRLIIQHQRQICIYLKANSFWQFLILHMMVCIFFFSRVYLFFIFHPTLQMTVRWSEPKKRCVYLFDSHSSVRQSFVRWQRSVFVFIVFTLHFTLQPLDFHNHIEQNRSMSTEKSPSKGISSSKKRSPTEFPKDAVEKQKKILKRWTVEIIFIGPMKETKPRNIGRLSILPTSIAACVLFLLVFLISVLRRALILYILLSRYFHHTYHTHFQITVELVSLFYVYWMIKYINN